MPSTKPAIGRSVTVLVPLVHGHKGRGELQRKGRGELQWRSTTTLRLTDRNIPAGVYFGRFRSTCPPVCCPNPNESSRLR